MGNAESHPVGPEVSSPTVKKGSKESPSAAEGNSLASTEDDVSSEKRENDKQQTARGGSQRRAGNFSNKERDEQINVNMPMADLMAYLQVVANNSNQLPLTIRDDPELDRTVSTLTAEDYARKSAAFVPADVRVIGGTFTRYGRVWDLPTTEEYNPTDGAQEPGRSYGGACCNTFLKVVYDAANEMGGAAQAATDALFDEDDEEDDTPSITGKSYKSGYSLEYGTANAPTTLTWAALLRQMKSEFKDIGYAQAPKLTTTRKIDLNQPFSLTPSNFNPALNRKRSLLIGCNYSGECQLKASHDDIRSMKDYIVNVHGFSENHMTILMDNDQNTPPTYNNIIEALKSISEQAQPGDAVFVQFSGHGGRVLDSVVDAEAESYDEIIVPTDYEQSGFIRDTLIFKTLLAPMRYGVTLTVMVDACDTGMVLELPYSWSTKGDRKDTVAKLSTNDSFSFVRVLKVVKTLYESSTFTQLGKTVGSALNPLQTSFSSSKEEELSRKSSKKDQVQKKSTSFFEAIAEACSVVPKNQKSFDDQSTINPRGNQDTLFDQMIKGCSLLASPVEEDFSDEDTFKTRTEDDYTYYSEGDSFETDTYDSSPRHRRSRKSSSRRRR